MHSSLFLGWKKSESGKVQCIESKDKKYATFECPIEGDVIVFKLIYVSGGGLSYTGNESDKGHWGGTNKGKNSIQIHITADKEGKVRVAPPADTPLDNERGIMAYSLPGVTNMDPELVFPDFVPAMHVQKDQKFRVWFGQDLSNVDEDDNIGETCVRVEVLYTK